MRKCPFCAEEIANEIVDETAKCEHCGADIGKSGPEKKETDNKEPEKQENKAFLKMYKKTAIVLIVLGICICAGVFFVNISSGYLLFAGSIIFIAGMVIMLAGKMAEKQ